MVELFLVKMYHVLRSFFLALETEGLFRRSPNVMKVKQLKDAANRGQLLTFDDPHEAAVLLKTVLRELREPLLTYDLYDEVMQFQSQLIL